VLSILLSVTNIGGLLISIGPFFFFNQPIFYVIVHDGLCFYI